MQSAADNVSGLSRPKLAVAVIASLYFFWCAYVPSQWHLIDGVNLVIHEAGHLIFSPLGEFMMIAGGSPFQVIMPALFVGYFWYHSKYYSAALHHGLGWWRRRRRWWWNWQVAFAKPVPQPNELARR